MGEVSRLGRRLKRFRELRGMSQTELYRASGVSRAVIANLEAGRRENVWLQTVEALAKALQISLDELTGFSPFENSDVEQLVGALA